MKNLKKITMIMVMGALSACGQAEQNTEASSEWEILFDGSSTDQWRGYMREDFPSEWIIDGDTLFYNSDRAGGPGSGNDIISKGEYGQFELNLEWKVAEGSNSGIFWHVVEDEKFENVYNSAAEMQVVDNIGHPDGRIVSHQAGDLYDMIASSVDASKPVGEWNEVRIIVSGNTLQQYLNGVKVVETTMWDDNWAAILADSKFATWPGFAQSKTGHFALQDHGNPVWYRNIKVKKLD
ncbi:MAG: DUF1080 domain-containing protein [Kordiimonadaceae bacterium]|jgi:hypothetical protein|nr:DUF1080 domain-containing protein [Kordiimonadaceae bacterium]MBT6031657.1 DUF1080 domain-containing protein [Kordiimonadaceae bacterium]